jgi:hypothetical protein
MLVYIWSRRNPFLRWVEIIKITLIKLILNIF